MKYENGLVSIITACHNGAKYVNSYVDTILGQDYPKCQLIFMDDGSTDDSVEKFNKRIPEIVNKGYQVEVHSNIDQHIAKTISDALPFVKGEYFIWPDIDDLMPYNSISDKVRFLDANPSYGIVRTNFKNVDESDLNTELTPGTHVFPKRAREKTNLFLDYISRQNSWFQPGCFMIRTASFYKANPDGYIFETRVGQDIQLLLPVLYFYKCGYIDDKLYIYIRHSGSALARARASYEHTQKTADGEEEIFIKTIEHMSIPQNEKEKYYKIVHRTMINEKLTTAISEHQVDDVKKYYKELKKNKTVGVKEFIKGNFGKYRVLHKIQSIRASFLRRKNSSV